MMNLEFKSVLAGRSRIQKIFFWSAVALLVYTLAGFFVLPLVVKYTLVKKIPAALSRQVDIDKVAINPYTLKVRIQGFNLSKKEGSGHFLAFDELVVNLQLASLFKRAVIVKHLSLVHPRLDLCRDTAHVYNFSDLLAGAGEAAPQEPPAPLLFSINNIEIVAGSITFDDRPKATVHQIDELNIAIPAISNLPYHLESYVQPAFSALINGTPMKLGGMVKPFADSQETSIDLKMVGIDIPSYLVYVPNQTGLALPSALVDLDVKISFVHFDHQGSRLSVTGEVVLRDLEVVDNEQRSYLRLPRLTLVFADANLLDKKVHLKRVSVEGLALEAWRQENGDILPLALLAPEGDGHTSAPQAQEGEEGTDLLVDIDLFEISGGSARFHDAATAADQAVVQQVDALSLRLTTFSTAPGKRADVSLALQLNGSGEIKGQGQLGAKPLFARLGFDLGNIAIKPWQAYIQERLNIAIADGALASSGTLTVEDQQGRLAVAFQGQAELAKLALVDTMNGDDLLGWQSLRFEGVDFSSAPQSLSIDTIGLQGLAAQVIIFADGASNISLLPVTTGPAQRQGAAPATKQEAAPGSPLVAINRLEVRDGKVEFVDRKVKPSYAAVLDDFHGLVTGLSSVRDSQALVDLRGKVNQHAPLVISGKVNPLQEKTFVDLQLDMRGLDLSHATPYTGTYVGYKTDKGKLHLDLQYLVDGRDLTGKNNVFLDQFSLGDKVDSPDDLNLPISLAIALLKNRQGEIILDVPVSGNLDDPEFSVGGVIFQVLVNLIAKAATSPFALLGSLVPDGEDLQTIAFEPGLAAITAEGQAKLDKIAYVLFERPGLKMDLMGQVEPAVDRRALARQLLVKMITLQKLQAAKIPQDDKSIAEGIELSKEEYERYLRRIFDLRLQASGKTPSPMPQTVEAMEEYIVSGLKVADDQLRLLAIDRANVALHYLAEQGGIGMDRLFVVEPHALQGQGSEEGGTALRLMIK